MLTCMIVKNCMQPLKKKLKTNSKTKKKYAFNLIKNFQNNCLFTTFIKNLLNNLTLYPGEAGSYKSISTISM